MKEENVLEIVSELNGMIFDKLGEKQYMSNPLSFTIISDGNFMAIEFEGHTIWNSEDDEREYNEEIDEFEPLKLFCVKQLMKYNSLINLILE